MLLNQKRKSSPNRKGITKEWIIFDLFWSCMLNDLVVNEETTQNTQNKLPKVTRHYLYTSRNLFLKQLWVYQKGRYARVLHTQVRNHLSFAITSQIWTKISCCLILYSILFLLFKKSQSVSQIQKVHFNKNLKIMW